MEKSVKKTKIARVSSKSRKVVKLTPKRTVKSKVKAKFSSFMDVVNVTQGREGGKEKTPIGQTREIIGIVCEIIAEDADALKALLSNGRRRNTRKAKTKLAPVRV